MSISHDEASKINGRERIARVLAYIHQHISEPISLNDIAEHSCWSRWQLQRVFQSQTGLSVATYVRELKLSGAAERILDTPDKLIDIAFDYGFNSEISFSRAFKQMFGLSPRAYRKAGVRTGLRKPLQYHSIKLGYGTQGSALADVRIETRSAFTIVGVKGQIQGLFSPQPDFEQRVPEIWQSLTDKLDLANAEHFGVFDLTSVGNENLSLTYWAGILGEKFDSISDARALESLTVPPQTYVVMNHKGSIETLSASLEWVLLSWLPKSGYRAIDGYEFERYPPNYNATQNNDGNSMEYWLPIERA
ncbi:helix-turn-helix domain-containing protein [Vibrio sp. WXL103]|uniref:GyrI-like domain-containing protein n=1 Tax=unclassified Vibrio TaxID=2614977 RepID=UPI003EC6EF69